MRQLKKNIAAIILISGCLSAYKFANPKPLSLYIDVIDQYYLPYKLNQLDTLDLGNGRSAYIHLKSYKGHMYLKVFKGDKLIAEGKYLNSLDTLKHYVERYDMNGKATLKAEKYFQPIKDSVWSYYDSTLHKLIKKEYLNGVLKN